MLSKSIQNAHFTIYHVVEVKDIIVDLDKNRNPQITIFFENRAKINLLHNQQIY
jgi:hypothetical protein